MEQMARSIRHHRSSRGGHGGSRNIVELKVEGVGSIGGVVAWRGSIELDHFVWILVAMVGIGRVAVVRLAIVPVHGDDKRDRGSIV